MNKALTILIILISAILIGSKFTAPVQAEGIDFGSFFKINQSGIQNQNKIETNEQEQNQEQNKEKEQLRIREKENKSGNHDFMIKGVITSSSSSLIVINNTNIKIDSQITGDVKIVGNTQVGAYAMVQGEIINSDYYAKKIVVNQRNKKDIEEKNEANNINATISAAPTPSITTDNSGSENATTTAKLDFGNIIENIQNFLNYLKDLASKI